MESISKFLDPQSLPTTTGDDLNIDKAIDNMTGSDTDSDTDSDTIEINVSNKTVEKPAIKDVVLPSKKESESPISKLTQDDSQSEENSEENDNTENTDSKEVEQEPEENSVEDKEQSDSSSSEESTTDTQEVKDEEVKTESVDEAENAVDAEDVSADQTDTEEVVDNEDTADNEESDESNPEVDHGESDLDVDTQQPAPLLKLEKEYEAYQTKKYVTPNGSKIIYVHKDSELCYCAFDFKVGSFYEDDSNRGISHLLEHLMFNGCPGMSSLEFNEKLDKLGMSVNAFTSRMVTSYHFSGLKANFITAFDLYSNLIKSFTATQEILEKEKGVVINEIGVRNDNNWEVLHDAVNAQSYRQHPIAHPIIGYEDVVRNISVEQVTEWYTKNYNSKNLTLYIIGNFSEEDLVFIGDKLQLFNTGEYNTDPVITDTMVLPFYKNVITHKEGAVQTLIDSSLMFKNEAFNIYEVSILANVLGGTMSSYLWNQFREERSIAYQVSAYTSNFDFDHINIHMYAGLNDSEDADLAKSIFKDALQYAKAITEEEFNKGLNIQLASQLFDEETEGGLMDIVRTTEYLKIDLDTYISTYKNLTYDSYQSFAESINPDNMVTGILYPLYN